jgi:hypothetical protein
MTSRGASTQARRAARPSEHAAVVVDPHRVVVASLRPLSHVGTADSGRAVPGLRPTRGCPRAATRGGSCSAGGGGIPAPRPGPSPTSGCGGAPWSRRGWFHAGAASSSGGTSVVRLVRTSPSPWCLQEDVFVARHERTGPCPGRTVTQVVPISPDDLRHVVRHGVSMRARADPAPGDLPGHLRPMRAVGGWRPACASPLMSAA